MLHPASTTPTPANDAHHIVTYLNDGIRWPKVLLTSRYQFLLPHSHATNDVEPTCHTQAIRFPQLRAYMLED